MSKANLQEAREVRSDMGKVEAKDRFSMKVTGYMGDNLSLANELKAHLEMFDIHLPISSQDWKAKKAEILDPDMFGLGAIGRLDEMAKAYYALSGRKGYYAAFGEGTKEDPIEFVLLAAWYSRNRIDYVWNYRKAQIIRKRYMDYLLEAKDGEGRKLTEHYEPVHLTLTVPHSGGKYKGEEFYLRRLLRDFWQLRNKTEWKEYIFGGEYGVEFTRGEHGLHIHIHSFLLQFPYVSLNKTRDYLTTEWKAITGNTSDYSGIHYENIYTKSGNKKNYIHRGEDLGRYVKGVMECIKYHFSPIALNDEGEEAQSKHDTELIGYLLSDSKGKRLYSRYGAFYKVKELNLNFLHEGNATDEEPEPGQAEGEEAEKDDSKDWGIKHDPNVLHPKTGKPANYSICIGDPLKFDYKGSRPKMNKKTRPRIVDSHAVSDMELEGRTTELKDIIRLDAKGKLDPYVDILEMKQP